MKKLFTIIAFAGVFMFAAENAKAQAQSQINIGLVGASLEFPIAEDISIAPFGATNWNLDYLVAGVKANSFISVEINISLSRAISNFAKSNTEATMPAPAPRSGFG